MGVSRRFALACVVGPLLVYGCGGDAGPNPPPPPPPAPGNLVKHSVDNQNGTVGEPVQVPPAVKVTTAAGAPIAGVTVTFAVASGGGSITGGTPATDVNGVATVGSWVLGPAAGTNTLTATIAATGVTGNPATFTASAAFTVFNPTANTSLSGTKSYNSVNIPAGVTVTMSGDLVLNVTGTVTIAGTLTGECVNLTINADGSLAITGTLNNGCTGVIPATLPSMTLVGKGGYSLGGTTVVAGNFTMTDDPTATDADFAPPAGAARAELRAHPGRAAVGVPCAVNNYTKSAVPFHAAHGANGNPNGTDGKDGSTWVLRCKGGTDIIVGSLSLTGQDGGNGGDGNHSSNTAAVSTGGKGGKGGTVKIQAVGSILLGGGSINTGHGGAGGSATADGSGGHGGNVGASATATGGNGAAPGLFTATAKTGTINITGGLTLVIGVGGRGGEALATGGDGHDAEPCPAAVGGPATATGGDGGSTPDKQLQAAGTVTGLGNVTVAGGSPGFGGTAIASAGKGGTGAKLCKPGALGGDPTARGGKGGDADLKDQNGVKIQGGGDGGSMTDMNGQGGQGWIDCVAPFEPGGPGGMGGTSRGSNGTAGTGSVTGTYGAAVFNNVSNGGDGGNGLGPGGGGPAGANSALLINVGATIFPPSFVPGNPGAICTGTTTKTFIVATPTADLSGHEPFLLQVGTRQAQVTLGASTMSISGLLNNSTIVLSGTLAGANFGLSGSGVINTGSGPRNVTVQFQGSIGANGIVGTLTITVQGFPNPAVYPVSDP
jgi:hypothetical protein